MNPGAAFFTFLLITQTILVLAVLLGGMYLLWCLSRLASGLERLATVAELWLEKESQTPFSAQSSASAPVVTPMPTATPPQPAVEVTPVTPASAPNFEARP